MRFQMRKGEDIPPLGMMIWGMSGRMAGDCGTGLQTDGPYEGGTGLTPHLTLNFKLTKNSKDLRPFCLISRVSRRVG